MIDWTQISSDPTDPKAWDAVQQYLTNISEVVERPWDCSLSTFRGFCDQWLFSQFNKEGPVLDIGFADHTCSPNDPRWRHGQLRKVISECYGLDLNKERVELIQTATALEGLIAGDLTQEPVLPVSKFAGIFAGDVIEHMDDPGSLLRFIRKRLKEDGIAIITTPNCYGKNARRIRKNGLVIDNLEHIAWFSPFQMNELCRRNNLLLKSIVYFREGKKRQLAQRIVPRLKYYQHKMRDVWCDDYSYIVCNRD